MKCKYKFSFTVASAAYVFDCEHCTKRFIILKKRFWGSHA